MKKKCKTKKIIAYIVTTDVMHYPDAPNYSQEFEVHTVEDIVSHVEAELHTFKGIYPDDITIFAYDANNKNSFEDSIFDYSTEKKGEKLIDVLDDMLEKIRHIDINHII